MKRVLPLVALIAVGLGPMSCSNDNPVSQAQLNAAEEKAAQAQAQLNAAEEKAAQAQAQLNAAEEKAAQAQAQLNAIQDQLNASQAQLKAAEGKAQCVSRCKEDYSSKISRCFDHFWDSDKRTCVNELNQTFETCDRRCEEDYD